MIVTVKRNLNIRKRPDTSSERIGIILAGKQLEVEGTVVGDAVDGNAVWFVDRNMNYYWSGGIEAFSFPATPPAPAPVTVAPAPVISEIFVNYAERMIRDNPAMAEKLQPIEEQKKITVAVLDSGIYEDHPDFKGAFDQQRFPSKNYTDTVSSKDVKGHGTHVAGLIGSRSDDKPGIVGVAPHCVLWNIKVNNDLGDSNGAALLKGLEEIQRNNVTVVNLSLDITYREYKTVTSTLKDLSQSTVIVAAAGNDNRLLHEIDVLYPAESPFVIAVGAITDRFFHENRDPNFNERLDFMLPMTPLMSCSTKEKGFYAEDFGSSMASALVSGMIATLIMGTGDKSPEAIRNLLNSIAKPYHQITDLKKLTLIRPT